MSRPSAKPAVEVRPAKRLRVAGTEPRRYTHCPEHGCALEPDGECLGCTGLFNEDDYPIFHD